MARRETFMGRTTIEGTPVDGGADGYVTGRSDGAESALQGTDRTGMEDPYAEYVYTPAVEQPPAQPAKKAPAKKGKTAKQQTGEQKRRSEAYAARKAAFLRGELPGYVKNKRGRIVSAKRSAAAIAAGERQEEGRQEERKGGVFSWLFGGG